MWVERAERVAGRLVAAGVAGPVRPVAWVARAPMGLLL